MSLKLFQELVTPTGGHKSEGVQNLLGRPPMNWISVVLREAVQNSWDARRGPGPVEFELHWRQPGRDQRLALRDQVFTDEPPEARIRTALQESSFDVLMLTDRGTKGLSGPVMANEEPEPGEKRNFVDFVWEIGRSEAAGPGGGTYGYGKTSFFRLSRLRAVCIYSRCMVKGRTEDRFIAAYLGASSSRHTGRSWWGQTETGSIRPMVGREAAEIALSIGMPAFAEGQCGTTIMMLSPRMEDMNRDDGPLAAPVPFQVTRTIAESLVQWFWPKMISIEGAPPAMVFRLLRNGEPLDIPDPESLPPFNVYVEALRLHATAREGRPTPTHAHVFPIACLRPQAPLGSLVVVKRAKRNRKDGCGDFGETSLRELYQQAHHVVLLRKPMLVVRYLKCARPASDLLDCAGVFVLNSGALGGEVEKAFALSEPATHDDWIPESLEEPKHKTFVRVAIRNIRQRFEEYVAPNLLGGGSVDQSTLGAFSELLGDLIAGNSDGTGARIGPETKPGGGGGGGGGSARSSRIELDGPAKVAEVEKGRCLVVPFRVVLAKGAGETYVHAIPVVLLEQGTEKEPPRNAFIPKVHSFCRMREGRESEVVAGGAALHITAQKAADQWVAKVLIPEDSRVRVDFAVDD